MLILISLLPLAGDVPVNSHINPLSHMHMPNNIFEIVKTLTLSRKRERGLI